jgi:hypothetical protein
MVRALVCLSVLCALAAGCHSAKPPELRVLGVHDEAAAPHVFVQLRNPASRPLRLTRLEYTFASAKGTTVSEGDVPLERDVPAGAVVVLEVPLEADSTEAMRLEGKVTAEQDEYVRTFRVAAQIQPH